jgi:putative ABC transport system permease protein
MTALLGRLLGRLPIGWLQLVHNKARLAAALAGVAFASVLVLMQLGFLGALIGTIKLPYDQMSADILISASDMNTLADGSPLPRQRMFEALSVQGVDSAAPLYYGKVDWKQPDGTIRNLDVFGIDPSAQTFRNPAINAHLSEISLSDVALIDARTRNVPKNLFAGIAAGEPYRFRGEGPHPHSGRHVRDRRRLLGRWLSRRLGPDLPEAVPAAGCRGAEPHSRDARARRRCAAVVEHLRATLPAYDSIVRTVEEAFAKDRAFQTTQRPVGLVFGFGVVIGILVGIIIVYQVLSTDVAEHLKEYATFKAIGYSQRFFLGIVFEEALILAVLGFIPGFLVSLGLYAMVAGVTGLPLAMTGPRVVFVLAGTLVMCALSGAIATRKLASANPADLF